MHEHEIPDLDIAVAILFRSTWGTTRDTLTVIEEDLAARSARACITHRPEIVFRSESRETTGVDLHFLEPDIGGFVIVLEDSDPEALLGQSQRLCQELPGILNSLTLEVVTEAEIAEHLEERVMPGGITDILEIVVLSTCPHAALRRSRRGVIALFIAEEDVLELHHAGIGKQQCRVIARHERGTRDDLVAVLAKKVQERLAELVARHGFHGAYGNNFRAQNAD